jgi:hypothetical protein
MSRRAFLMLLGSVRCHNSPLRIVPMSFATDFCNRWYGDYSSGKKPPNDELSGAAGLP